MIRSSIARTKSGISGVWLLIALLSSNWMLCFQAAAQSPTMCPTQVTGLPQRNLTPPPPWIFPNNAPDILQDPSQDSGWSGAFNYRLENGTNQPDGAFQVIQCSAGQPCIVNKTTQLQQDSMLYFSFKIVHDPDLDSFDSVVLGLDNRGGQNGSQQYSWIVIQPFFSCGPNGCQANINAQQVPGNDIQVWTATTTSGGAPVWSNSSVLGPGWITAGTAGSYAGTDNSWYVTISIDNSLTRHPDGPNLPVAAGSRFGAYLNAVRTNPTESGLPPDWQFTFPPNFFMTSTTNPGPPNPSTDPSQLPTSWAISTLDLSTKCSGVYLTYGDITNWVNGAQSGLISSNHANTLQAIVHNSGADAPGIQGTFKIANFGMPAGSDWQVLGYNECAHSNAAGQNLPECALVPTNDPDDSVANNPSTTGTDVPAHDINATVSLCSNTNSSGHDSNHDGCAVITAGPWALGPDNVKFYTANPHECVRVDLNPLVPGPAIISNSVWQNFDVQATASEFRSYPAIISSNYPDPGSQRFTIKVHRQEILPGSPEFQALSARDAQAPSAAEKEVHYLSYVVAGCRLTGQYLTIQGPPSFGPDRKRVPGPSKKFENCASTGAYGYLIRHVGPVKYWNYELQASGDGVHMQKSKKDPEQYALVIEHGKRAKMVAVVTPSVKPGDHHHHGICDEDKTAAVPFASVLGILAVGLASYRRRNRRS